MSTLELVEAPRRNWGNLVLAGGLALGATLVGADQRIRHADERELSTEPDFLVEPNPNSNRTLIQFYGCQSASRTIHEMLRRYRENNSVISVVYPEKDKFDPDEICEGLMAKLTETKDEDEERLISTLGLSMGGMMGAYFANYVKENTTTTQQHKYIGRFDQAITDGMPATWMDISRTQRLQVRVAQLVPNGSVMNRLKRRLMEGKTTEIHHEPGVDRALVEQRQIDKIRTPLSALAAQGKFMQKFQGPDLEGFFQEVHHIYAAEDPTVNPETALSGVQEIYGGGTLHIDPRRPADSHAATPDYPSYVGNLLNQRLHIAA